MKAPPLFWKRYVGVLLATSASFWIAKSASFFLAELSFGAQLFLCLVIVVANGCALWGLSAVYRLANKKTYQTLFLLGLACFVVALPFAPDIVVLLKGMNPIWWPLAFLLVSLTVVGLLLILRLPALWLLNRYGLKAMIGALILTHLCEALTLVVVPFVYTTSFAVPFVFKPQLNDALSSATHLIVLVNPEISDEKREALQAAGWNGVNEVAEAVALRTHDIKNLTSYQRVTYIFPETALFASEHQVRQLYALLSAQHAVVPVALVLGVRDGNQNVVYGVTRVADDSVQLWPIQIKSDLVPLVEGSFAGFYLGAEGTQTRPGTQSEALTNWSELSFLANSQLFICYEALWLKNIFSNQRPAFVLTNHSLFSTWFVTSQAYDAALRTLYTLAGRTLILVGNFGATQAFLAPKREFVGTAFYVEKLGLSKIKP